MCSDSKTIAQAMRFKITALGITTKQATEKIAEECGVTTTSVYTWISGNNRPRRQHLNGISKVLRMHHSRLNDLWVKTAVAVRGKSVAKKAKKKTLSKKVAATFVPSKDSVEGVLPPYMQLAVDLAILPEEKRNLVIAYADNIAQTIDWNRIKRFENAIKGGK
tara:strand:+ start:300 stop:788 length:489 start_codon:yes stop_codon:yes gene_type:complete